MRDPQFLSRRRNGTSEGGWRGPREPDDGERDAGGWWALGRPLARGGGSSAEEPDDPASKSKRQLYREAKDAGIEGRSSMNKAQLAEALRRHQAVGLPPEPAPRRAPAPARRPSAGRAPRPQPREAEGCRVAYRPSDSHGEFQVIVTEADGSHTAAARSPVFPAPTGEIRRTGAAKAAHDLLVKRLIVSGWWPAGSGDAWPDLQFVRVRPVGEAGGRSLVTVVREGGQAHFVAELLDGYGNASPLLASHPFRAPRLMPVRPSRQARAALRQVVERLERDGWTVAEHVGSEWYSVSLWRGGARRRRTDFG